MIWFLLWQAFAGIVIPYRVYEYQVMSSQNFAKVDSVIIWAEECKGGILLSSKGFSEYKDYLIDSVVLVGGGCVDSCLWQMSTNSTKVYDPIVGGKYKLGKIIKDCTFVIKEAKGRQGNCGYAFFKAGQLMYIASRYKKGPIFVYQYVYGDDSSDISSEVYRTIDFLVKRRAFAECK